MIWNPCIRKVVTLPQLTINTSSDEVYAILHGFGYDSRTNDYKVVRIVIYRAQTGRKTSYEIWSLAQPFWKALGNLPPVDDFRPGLRTIFLRGAVHWVHGCREDGIWNSPPYYTIVSFDMSDEVFGEITMPQVMMTKSFVTISRYRNSLAMLQWDHALDCSQQLDMWVMQEYGVVESWTKLLTVKLPASAFNIGRLGFRNSGETLIKYINTRVATCNFHVHQLLNPDSEDNADFQVRGGKFYQYVFMEPFVESLVLLDHPYAISTCD